MRIEVLYFEGCPNHRPAVELVKEIVDELGVAAQLEEVEVNGPEEVTRRRFFGSPTIQVDGVDIDPTMRGRDTYSFSCRTYTGASGIVPRELIRTAISEAQSGELSEARGGQSVVVTVVGSMLAAVVASACCWLPLLLVAFGVSAAGVSSAFESSRPFFLAVAALLVAVGFYLTRSSASCCDEKNSCTAKRVWNGNRIAVWFAAIAVAALALFPNYSSVFRAEANDEAVRGVGPSIVLEVDGMTCEGCATSLQSALEDVLGVNAAKVDFEAGSAVVWVSPENAPEAAAILVAVKDAGFDGRVKGK